MTIFCWEVSSEKSKKFRKYKKVGELRKSKNNVVEWGEEKKRYDSVVDKVFLQTAIFLLKYKR